jgi:hypothetical protein
MPKVLNSNATQITVPKLLQSQLLKLVHDIPASRHLYGVNCDVKSECKTCDVCQRMGIKGIQKGYYITATDRSNGIAIDIIGILTECEESGNRFIRFCLPFPISCTTEACMQHVAKEVVEASISGFTRYSFLCEFLLSDQRSDLMQIDNHDFHKECPRSSWHPETKGACERFNGTLKTMLRTLPEKYSEIYKSCFLMILFA